MQARFKHFKTLHIDGDIKDALYELCEERNWKLNYVVEGLIADFLNGGYTGSAFLKQDQ